MQGTSQERSAGRQPKPPDHSAIAAVVLSPSSRRMPPLASPSLYAMALMPSSSPLLFLPALPSVCGAARAAAAAPSPVRQLSGVATLFSLSVCSCCRCRPPPLFLMLHVTVLLLASLAPPSPSSTGLQVGHLELPSSLIPPPAHPSRPPPLLNTPSAPATMMLAAAARYGLSGTSCSRVGVGVVAPQYARPATLTPPSAPPPAPPPPPAPLAAAAAALSPACKMSATRRRVRGGSLPGTRRPLYPLTPAPAPAPAPATAAGASCCCWG